MTARGGSSVTGSFTATNSLALLDGTLCRFEAIEIHDCAGLGLLFFDLDEVTHLAHHSQNLGGGFVLDRIVQFLDSESLKRQFLALRSVDGAAHLGDLDLGHGAHPLNTRCTDMPRKSATSDALRIIVRALNVALTTF